MTDLLPPLVPADVDLRGYPFTPIFRARLFGSSFHAHATDAEWRAGVTLWLKSWDQEPAGTLPHDDVALCRLAELGRDLKAWSKVKTMALHGWSKRSDGRLHHEVVAEGVLEAWEGKRRAAAKGKAGASKRWGTGNATAMPQPVETDSTGIAQAMPGDSNREGKGEGYKYSVPDGTGTADAAPPDLPPLESKSDLLDIPLGLLKPPGGDWGVLLFRQGLNWLAATAGKPPAKLRPQLGRWRKMAGDDDQRLFGLLVQAQRDRVADPLAWIEAALQDRPAERPPEVDHERIKRLAGVA
jgi:hypothetical protein